MLRPVLALLLTTAAALAETTRVATDLAVTQGLVEEVLGAEAPPPLLPPGSDPHHAALAPSQASHLESADLLVWMGPALTPGLRRAAGLLPAGATELRLLDDGQDPHAWLDPAVARRWLGEIAEALAARDPAAAAGYRARAAAAAGRIAAAEGSARLALAGAGDAGLVVPHDAYGPFATAFGLTVAGALADSDDAPPSARRLADLRATAAGGGARCVLAEAEGPGGAADRFAADTGLPLVRVDPLGAALAPGADRYPRLIRALAEAVASCVR